MSKASLPSLLEAVVVSGAGCEDCHGRKVGSSWSWLVTFVGLPFSSLQEANGIYRATDKEYCDAPAEPAQFFGHFLGQRPPAGQVYEHADRGKELKITREPHKNATLSLTVTVKRSLIKTQKQLIA